MRPHPPTDKGEQGYLPTYQRIAAELGPAARVCELGIDGGGSLRLWRELFPAGDITGVDNATTYAEAWPEDARTIIADQSDPELPAVLGGSFDLIVDDASHLGIPTLAAFRNLWPLVNPGGYYVVEDWFVGLPGWPERFVRLNGFYARYIGDSMLETVQSFLTLLPSQDAECDEIIYRYGLAIIHKRRSS